MNSCFIEFSSEFSTNFIEFSTEAGILLVENGAPQAMLVALIIKS
jgi:hypothetical protein